MTLVPMHHYAVLVDRTDIEDRLHSSSIVIAGGSVKLKGGQSQARLFEVIATGPGRITNGKREPVPTTVGSFIYINTYNVAHRIPDAGAVRYQANMSSIMATLDPATKQLECNGDFVLSKPDEARMRKAVLGESRLYLPGGGEVMSDDQKLMGISFETVVKVGPGKPSGAGWEAPTCVPGDLIYFTKTTITSALTIAGQQYTLVPWSHVLGVWRDGNVSAENDNATAQRVGSEPEAAQ